MNEYYLQMVEDKESMDTEYLNTLTNVFENNCCWSDYLFWNRELRRELIALLKDGKYSQAVERIDVNVIEIGMRKQT